MITAPVFQFMAVRFALLAQGSDIRERVCGEGFQMYFLEGRSYEAAFRWIEQLYSNYYLELRQYQNRLNRLQATITNQCDWIASFTERFFRVRGIESDQRIIILQAGIDYPPLLGLLARQLSAPALSLLYELAELVQHMPQGSLLDAERHLERMKLAALQLKRPSEIFITGVPILAVYQAVKEERQNQRSFDPQAEMRYYKNVSFSSSIPRIDLSEPDVRWCSKDRTLARRLRQSGSRI